MVKSNCTNEEGKKIFYKLKIRNKVFAEDWLTKMFCTEVVFHLHSYKIKWAVSNVVREHGRHRGSRRLEEAWRGSDS